MTVLENWGFSYAGIEVIWLKTRTDGSPARGVGHFTACNVEFLVVGLRGDVRHVPAELRLHSLRREHSRKPDEVRAHVVALADKNG